VLILDLADRLRFILCERVAARPGRVTASEEGKRRVHDALPGGHPRKEYDDGLPCGLRLGGRRSRPSAREVSGGGPEIGVALRLLRRPEASTIPVLWHARAREFLSNHPVRVIATNPQAFVYDVYMNGRSR